MKRNIYRFMLTFIVGIAAREMMYGRLSKTCFLILLAPATLFALLSLYRESRERYGK